MADLKAQPATRRITVTTQGILFDMDGVLVSSIGSAERCWRAWARRYEIPGWESFQFPHGVRASDTIAQLRPDVDQLEALRVIEDLELDDMGDLTVLPGVRDLLSSLPQERWCIVTSCTRRLLEGRLRAADLPIPANLISGADVTRGKPDPEPYRRGAAVLGVKPEDCIVVEDATAGVGAGVAAGSRVLAVLTSTPAEQLRHATWIVPSLKCVTASMANGALELSFVPMAKSEDL